MIMVKGHHFVRLYCFKIDRLSVALLILSFKTITLKIKVIPALPLTNFMHLF